MSQRVHNVPFTGIDNSANSMVRLSLYPRDLLNYWRRCGLTADFGATFFSFCFHESESARNSLSFILNEVVENAVKYSSESRGTIDISLYEVGKNLIFEVTNWTLGSQGKKFLEFSDKLRSSEDLEGLYFEIMQKNMVEDNSSGIGLLTILNDYNVQMAILCGVEGPVDDNIKVAVQIMIDAENIG